MPETIPMRRAAALSGVPADILRLWRADQWITTAPEDARRLSLATTFAAYVVGSLIRANRPSQEWRDSLAVLAAGDLLDLLAADRPLFLVLDGAWELTSIPGIARLSRSGGWPMAICVDLRQSWKEFKARREELEGD